MVKTTDDVARLEEIVTQLNEQGADIDTSADWQTQLNQAKNYYAELEIEQDRLVKKSANTLRSLAFGQSFFGGGQFDKLIETEAGKASIRTVAKATIEGMDEVQNAQLQAAILNAAVENVKTIFADGKENWTMFDEISENLEQLDDALQDGSIESLANAYAELSESSQELLQSGDPLFEFLETIDEYTATVDGKKINELATKLTELGFSLEDLNLVNEALDGAELEDFYNLVLEADVSTSEAIANSRRELGNELIRINQEYNEKLIKQIEEYNNSMIAEYIEQVNTVKQLRNAVNREELNEYGKLLYDKRELELDYETSLILDTTDYGSLLNKASGKTPAEILNTIKEIKAKLEEYENLAEIDVENIINSTETYGTIRSVNEINDSVTSLTSSVERLTQATDLNNLSFSEQLELLKDYPELADNLQSGTITLEEKMALFGEKLQGAVETAKTSREDALNQIEQLSDGRDFTLFEDITLSQLYAEDEAGNLARQAISKLTAEEIKEAAKIYAEEFNIQDEDEAIKAIHALIGASTTAITEDVVLNKLLSEGLFAFTSDELKEQYQEAADIYKQQQTLIEAYEKDLERYEKGSEAYVKAEEGRNAALKLSSEQASLKIQEARDEIKKSLGGKYKDIFTEVNGQIIINENAVEKAMKGMSDVEKANFRSEVMFAFETYKEGYEEIFDAQEQIRSNNEKLAQSFIDTQMEITEKEIEELEKRKEAYEEYFDELDALQEEQDYEQDRESLVKQIQALSGGSGTATNQKLKELRQQLNELEEEELRRKTEEQRNTLLTSMDKQIDTANETLDNIDNSLALILSFFESEMGDEEKAEFRIKLENLFGKNQVQEWMDQGVFKKYATGGLVDYTGPA